MAQSSEASIENESKLRVIESDMLNVLYQRGRKYYLRLRRKSTKTGVDTLYTEYYKQIGLTKEEADELFYKFMKKKYPDLVKMIRTQKDN